MEISEKARPDGWNKVYEDVSCAPKRERGGSEREREGERELWRPGIKKKRGSCGPVWGKGAVVWYIRL